MQGLQLGLWLPTFGSGEFSEVNQLVEDASRLAERSGFSSIWVIDHPLAGAEIHDVSWLEPLISLTAAASVTETIRLGTAVLVPGIRHPLWLAKQLASLAWLAGERITLGAASGWYGKEFEAVGRSIRDRRDLTDESLAATRLLLENSSVTFEGQHWSFEGLSIAPRPSWRIPFHIGGGTRLPEAGSSNDVAKMSNSVVQRIATYEGWLAPCAGSEESTIGDLEIVKGAIGDKQPFEMSHVQWIHLVDTDDQERALQEQLPALRAVLGSWHTKEHLQRTYLTGSIKEIRARLKRMHAAGFDQVVLGPVVKDLGQVEMLGDRLRGIGE